MDIPKFPCRNHPQTLSARRCYHCKAYICTACQQVFRHHIFCGYRCVLKHTVSVVLSAFKRKQEILYVLITFAAVQVVLYLYFINRASEVIMERLTEREYTPRIDTAGAVPLTLDSAFFREPDYLQIRGRAPGNTILGLWHNGRFVSTVIPVNYRYQFPAQYLFSGKNEFIVWALSDQGKVSRVDSMVINYFSARLAGRVTSVDRIQTDQNVLALTFDAGSSDRGADSILSILAETGVQSTIFLTGGFISAYPQLVRKIVEQGHEIGNHTLTHPHLTDWAQQRSNSSAKNVDRFFVQRQLQQTDSLFFAATHQNMSLFWRAPYGEYNPQILLWAAEIGYRHIGWSPRCDSWDWVSDPQSNLYRSADQIYRHFMDLEQNGQLKGAIVLMHLGTDRQADYAYRSLKELITRLQQKNYKLLKISQLIGWGRSL